jgi:hypothetical protein
MVQALTRLEALERREGTTASLVEKLFGRVERLEEQNRQLELRNARLTRTVRALQQMNGAVGADGALPADEPPPTLDMLPDEALARVGSFVGTRDLRRLALVSRRFTKRRRAAAAAVTAEAAGVAQATDSGLSVIMDAARQHAVRLSEFLVVHPPRPAEETWMHVLHRLERPLFDQVSGQGRIRAKGVEAYAEPCGVLGEDDEYAEVLCSSLQMLAGRHYAEFTILLGREPEVINEFGDLAGAEV